MREGGREGGGAIYLSSVCIRAASKPFIVQNHVSVNGPVKK